MRDERTNKQTLKIELLSQWKLEAEFRNYIGTLRDGINRPINRLYECTHFVNRKA